MQVKVIDVDTHGNGYCVVTNDDGSTFGQHFHGAPVDAPVEFDAVVDAHVAKAAARNAPVVQREVHADVVTQLGSPRVVQLLVELPVRGGANA